MVDLFHRKPDVYIRQLQLCMRIIAINFPAAVIQNLFVEPPLDPGGVDDRDRPKSAGNSDIEHLIFAYINAGL